MNNCFSKKFLSLAILVSPLFLAILFLTGDGRSDDATETDDAYVGADRCRKCHQRDNTYQSWAETAHAHAWETLGEEFRTDTTCVGCHSTGRDTLGQLLTGVQCEACHGPGKNHRRLTLAESRREAERLKISFIDEGTCRKCHNENIPEMFRPEEPFDFERDKHKGTHDHRGYINHELLEH